MYFSTMARLSWRTGATFVHDWFALALGLLVIDHVFYAMKDSGARRGMRTGQVSAAWTRAEHAGWADEMRGPSQDAEAEPRLPS
jgi:formate dehydrogenase subunit gamma